MHTYSHILFAADLTQESVAVGKHAVDLARRYGARLSLVHVLEYVPMDPANELLMAPATGWDQLSTENAGKKLAELAEVIGASDADAWVEMDSVKAEILRVAQQKKADLIIVGSHGRHGLELLLGSTANALLHAAPCDVLAVRLHAP